MAQLENFQIMADEGVGEDVFVRLRRPYIASMAWVVSVSISSRFGPRERAASMASGRDARF